MWWWNEQFREGVRWWWNEGRERRKGREERKRSKGTVMEKKGRKNEGSNKRQRDEEGWEYNERKEEEGRRVNTQKGGMQGRDKEAGCRLSLIHI